MSTVEDRYVCIRDSGTTTKNKKQNAKRRYLERMGSRLGRSTEQVVVVVGLEELAIDLETREELKVSVRRVMTFLEYSEEPVAGRGLCLDWPGCGGKVSIQRRVIIVPPQVHPRLAIHGALEIPVSEAVSFVVASMTEGVELGNQRSGGAKVKLKPGRRHIPGPTLPGFPVIRDKRRLALLDGR